MDMIKENNAAVLIASINTIKATKAGGWTVTFDVPDTSTDEITKLAKHRQKVLTLCILTGDASEDV